MFVYEIHGSFQSRLFPYIIPQMFYIRGAQRILETPNELLDNILNPHYERQPYVTKRDGINWIQYFLQDKDFSAFGIFGIDTSIVIPIEPKSITAKLFSSLVSQYNQRMQGWLVRTTLSPIANAQLKGKCDEYFNFSYHFYLEGDADDIPVQHQRPFIETRVVQLKVNTDAGLVAHNIFSPSTDDYGSLLQREHFEQLRDVYRMFILRDRM